MKLRSLQKSRLHSKPSCSKPDAQVHPNSGQVESGCTGHGYIPLLLWYVRSACFMFIARFAQSETTEAT